MKQECAYDPTHKNTLFKRTEITKVREGTFSICKGLYQQ